MENPNKPNIESKEKIPRWNTIKVFRVRHGHTTYREQSLDTSNDTALDLTEKGVREIQEAAETISLNLNKEQDVIAVVYSPRKRTRDSAQIIKTYLQDKGFVVLEDPKRREEQYRMRGVDILDKASKPISHDRPEYAAVFTELRSRFTPTIPEGMTGSQYWKEGGTVIEGIPVETPDSVDKRSKDQLAFLMRIAHTIQPRSDKHIVIIQLEHEETLDDLISRATNGMFSISNDNGPKTGEVFALEISTKGDEVKINSLSRDLPTKSLHFDYLKRDFR